MSFDILKTCASVNMYFMKPLQMFRYLNVEGLALNSSSFEIIQEIV